MGYLARAAKPLASCLLRSQEETQIKGLEGESKTASNADHLFTGNPRAITIVAPETSPTADQP